jgi:ligand-binding sensor domain-containing protein
MRFTLILFIIFSCIFSGFGQSYTWTSFRKDNSPLPSDNLNTLYWDEQGILWIGSDSGLTGYNGTAWVNYNAAANGLAAEEIRSIQINPKLIWLGTNNGLSSGQINDLDDISWDTAYRTDNSDLIHNSINTINIDSLGARWVCTDSGITIITDSSWYSFAGMFLSKSKVLSINQQPTFMQYIGTENGGVSRLQYNVDGISGASTILKQWTSFPDSTGRTRGLLSDTVTSIMIDKNGDRWFGTPHGLSFHTGAFLKNPYSWYSYTMENGLINENVQALAEDSSGAIWIGTTGGVSRLIPADTTWANFTVEDGLLSNNVRDIAITNDGVIWLATDGGLSKLTIVPTAIYANRQPIPKSFDVYPAYPNPFNMSTTIKVQLHSRDHIKISIFDISGRLINTILSSSFTPGIYKVNWNGKNSAGKDMASGIYFASISFADQKSFIKLVLIK